MENGVDFDALVRKTIASNGAMEDLNVLYAATFSLPEWLFVARGEFPNLHPYIASNADYADNRNMVRAFTDSVRLARFAKENNLTDETGSSLSLSIPVAGIINYLEQFIDDGAYGVWFNSDHASDGYFVPIKQLRVIKTHLEKLNLIQRPEKKKTVETAIVVVRDGLMLPSGFTKTSEYTCNYFCRIPSDWADGEHVEAAAMERLFEKIYGEKWREGNSDGSRYVVQFSNSKVLTPETARETTWVGTTDTPENRYYYYIASENGELKKVSEEEFQTDINSAFEGGKVAETAQPEPASAPANNAAPANNPEPAIPPSPEIATTLKDADSYLSSFRQGAVTPETSLTSLFRAIAPLLENYQGAGEFTEMFSPGNDASDMSDLFEDVTSNSHGPYLKYRSYIYQPRRTEPRIDFQTIGSNRLTNLQTSEKLIVNFTLRKNLEDSVTKLIVRFLGREPEVEKLLAAVAPVLEAIEFKVLLESKGKPLPESLKLLEDEKLH